MISSLLRPYYIFCIDVVVGLPCGLFTFTEILLFKRLSLLPVRNHYLQFNIYSLTRTMDVVPLLRNHFAGYFELYITLSHVERAEIR